MAKFYEIRDYSHRPNWVEYVSEHTTSMEDFWTTSRPIDPREAAKFQESVAPKRFSKRSEAQPYLDALRSARLEGWEKEGHYYKANGYRRPAWKIYVVTEQ